jgi:hypothetical protein
MGIIIYLVNAKAMGNTKALNSYHLVQWRERRDRERKGAWHCVTKTRERRK